MNTVLCCTENINHQLESKFKKTKKSTMISHNFSFLENGEKHAEEEDPM